MILQTPSLSLSLVKGIMQRPGLDKLSDLQHISLGTIGAAMNNTIEDHVMMQSPL